MLIENITYLTVFIVSSGIAAMGILKTYQQFQADKNNTYQSLLYQQIFLFSFFFYSIWGNMAIRMIISQVNPVSELISKLAFLLPMPGLPFLMVSWFMLIKFSLQLRSRKLTKGMIYSYYGGFILLFAVASILYYNELLFIPEDPDVVLLRLFAVTNLLIHLMALIPLFKSTVSASVQFDTTRWTKALSTYLAGTVINTTVLYFSGFLGPFMMAGSLLLLFVSGALLPFGLMYAVVDKTPETDPSKDNFEAFCTKYQISKREAEIVREICKGKSNQAIADNLFITLQTVKDHTHRIYTKTQVKSRVQLANLVREKTGRLKPTAPG